MDVRLRPTTADDLAFVMELERKPENAPFIGAWERAEHEAAIARPDREHWIIERDGARAGFLIAFDVRAAGCGVYIKRVAAWPHGGGAGGPGLRLFLDHAFRDLRADYVWLSVRRGNERAQRVYEHLGFLDFDAPRDVILHHRTAVGRRGLPRNRLMIVRRQAEEEHDRRRGTEAQGHLDTEKQRHRGGFYFSSVPSCLCVNSTSAPLRLCGWRA